MDRQKEDSIIEAYARVWKEHGKSLAEMPVPDVDLKKLRKWHRRSPRQKLLRREVACLIAAVVMLAWFLFNFNKGMEMPVAYIMTLLLMLLCVTDSVYALRLIALTNPITSSIPDMLKNCAKLRLYQKIELLVALAVVTPLGFLFMVPVVEWMCYSMNLYMEKIYDIPFWVILMTAGVLGVLASIYMYRSNLRLIKDTIKEIREYKH